MRRRHFLILFCFLLPPAAAAQAPTKEQTVSIARVALKLMDKAQFSGMSRADAADLVTVMQFLEALHQGTLEVIARVPPPHPATRQQVPSAPVERKNEE